jgi:hypothetical protein
MTERESGTEIMIRLKQSLALVRVSWKQAKSFYLVFSSTRQPKKFKNQWRIDIKYRFNLIVLKK